MYLTYVYMCVWDHMYMYVCDLTCTCTCIYGIYIYMMYVTYVYMCVWDLHVHVLHHDAYRFTMRYMSSCLL